MVSVFEQTYFLTPAECTPEGRMPITLLINRLIEVATLHANDLNIGYENLVKTSETWVLSRVAVEMQLYPAVNDHYTIRTWVCSINRLFSERDFEILLADGTVIGHARTIWAVINTSTRTASDISRFEWISSMVPSDKFCPVEKPTRPVAVSNPTRTHTYRFTYCDLDVNRHVNSSRYIELLLNRWSLEFHDRNRLTRFEIAYMHEARYDDTVEVRLSEAIQSATNASDAVRAEILCGNTPVCRSLLVFSPR